MDNIIVPIDFSFFSENAFLSAMEIAAKSGAGIICVNVVLSDLDWEKMSLTEKQRHQEVMDMEEEATEKLNAFVANHRLGGIPVQSMVKTGVPAEVIVTVAHKHLADLIVIGAYGKGYEEGRFIGSNLQKVIRSAPCPVLAVKQVLGIGTMKKMAYASLFNEISKPAFSRMKPFIQSMKAEVYFLYVNTPGLYKNRDKAMEQIKNYTLGQEDLIIHPHVYESMEAEKGIIAFCESNDIDLIGIATQTRKSSSSYQVGVTETVIFQTDIPVLSVKNPLVL